jgi:hypothetical protein
MLRAYRRSNKYQFYTLWFDPRYTALKTSMISITPPMRFSCQWSIELKILIISSVCFINICVISLLTYITVILSLTSTKGLVLPFFCQALSYRQIWISLWNKSYVANCVDQISVYSKLNDYNQVIIDFEYTLLNYRKKWICSK